MESRTLTILPTSYTGTQLYYTIPGSYKYLTKKLRLADFKIRLSEGHRNAYFDARGIYSLIKNISFLDKQGQIIDSMANTDYMALKMIHQNNPAQRDINRILFQNAGLAIEAPSFSQVELSEKRAMMPITQVGSYIDLSFMSNYLLARSISDDFIQIQIELNKYDAANRAIDFDKAPTLFIDEILTAQPVDSADVVLYDMIVPDKIPIRTETIAVVDDTSDDWTTVPLSKVDTRMNSYTNQMLTNLYLYPLENTVNGTPISNGFCQSLQETAINLILDGKVMMPFGGLNSDARRLAHMTDMTGEMHLPAVEAYYANIASVPYSREKLGLFNENLGKKYNGSYGYSCVGVNNVVVGEMTLQFAAKFKQVDIKQPLFIQALAEVKRFYKRSTGQVGNFVGNM